MEYKLQESLGFLLYVADLKCKNILLKKFRDFNITPEQWVILNQLYEKDGCNQKELADITVKDPASLTRILDRMVKKEIVKRVSCPDDRRAFLIYLTDKGRELRNKLVPRLLDPPIIDKVLKGLSEDEVKQLKNLLRKLAFD